MWISESEAVEALNPHLEEILSFKGRHEIVDVRPDELLSPHRLDVMAKYLYARHRTAGIHSDWASVVYREHLRVWNAFKEGDGSGKESFEDYRHAFDLLLDSFARDGFDASKGLVPVGRGDISIDGAHRVAAALAFGCPIRTIRFDFNARIYDYRYFEERGLDSDVLDAMVLEYCRRVPSVRVVVLFPVAGLDADRFRSMVSEAGTILFEKDVPILSTTGRTNLIRLLYRNEPWVGSSSRPTAGVMSHVTNRFRDCQPVRFVFIVSPDRKRLRAVKHRIRALLGMGNRPVHINDTHEQTVSIAESVLNRNSIHLLNHAAAVDFKTFDALFRRMQGWIAEKNMDIERFAIDGSSVMAAYGIRDVVDLDYLYAGESPPESPGPEIACHNGEIPYHDVPLNDLVMDPRHFFYWYGMKFVSIERIRSMKMRRGEPKDAGDVYRIDVIEGRLSALRRVLKWGSTLRGPIRSARFRLLDVVRRFLPDRLVPFARWVYRMPRRVVEAVGPEQRTTAYRGFELHYSRRTSLIESIRGGRIYEPDVSRRIIETLKRSNTPVFLDVGANIGIITLNVLAEVPDARVAAFEPGPHQADLLARTIAANRIADRVELVRDALGREKGKASFAVHKTHHASGDGFHDTRRAGPTTTIDVTVTTIDDWWRAAGQPEVHAVKIDTEGAELLVLDGAREMIEHSKPLIVFELHPDNLRVYPHEASDLLDFFVRRGWIVTTVEGGTVTPGNLETALKSQNDFAATFREK